MEKQQSYLFRSISLPHTSDANRPVRMVFSQYSWQLIKHCNKTWRQSNHNPRQTQSEWEIMMRYGEHKSMIWSKRGTRGEGKQGSMLRTNHTVLLPNKQTLFHLQKKRILYSPVPVRYYQSGSRMMGRDSILGLH